MSIFGRHSYDASVRIKKRLALTSDPSNLTHYMQPALLQC